MTAYTWRTDTRGVVTVSSDGVEYDTPTLNDSAYAKFRANVATPWAAIVAEACGSDMPVAWPLSIIGHESAFTGDEMLIEYGKSRDPATIMSSSNIGVGLMQLSNVAFKKGRTLAQLQDGRINIKIGVDHLKFLRRLTGASCDLPWLCSLFNAGVDIAHKRPWPSATDPFGLRESAGYIMSVLRINNSYLLGPTSNVGNPSAIPSPANVAGIAGSGGFVAASLLALGITWPWIAKTWEKHT